MFHNYPDLIASLGDSFSEAKKTKNVRNKLSGAPWFGNSIIHSFLPYMTIKYIPPVINL